MHAPADTTIAAIQRARLLLRREVGGRTEIAGTGAAKGPVTGARNLYPRLARVSTNRGLSAESRRTSRSLLMAAFRLWSKSTNVSAGHRRRFNSSRVTT